MIYSKRRKSHADILEVTSFKSKIKEHHPLNSTNGSLVVHCMSVFKVTSFVKTAFSYIIHSATI